MLKAKSNNGYIYFQCVCVFELLKLIIFFKIIKIDISWNVHSSKCNSKRHEK